MFDLMELDQLESGLRALSRGVPKPTHRMPAPQSAPRGDIAKCPFHNDALAHRQDIAA